MANFQYDPPTGPISGVSFEEQTELAINDLHGRVDGAETGIAEADDTANQALTSANEAKEQAGQAQTTADGAVTSIAQTNQNLSDTTTTANNAMSRANDAFDLAAISWSQAGDVSVGLSNHIADTNNPHHVTAEQVGAVTPTELSNALGGISQQIQGAMGTFTVSTDPVDLNGEYLGAEKLFLTSAASANLPPDVTVPAWLMVYVTSDGTGVTQRCWENSGTLLIYERTGAVNNSDPQNPVVTWYPWNTIATPTVVKSVSVETDPDGQPAGTYLVFVMDTESGDETTYLNMSQVSGGGYTSGNGAVDISADNKISLKLDPAKSSGLIVAASGLQTVPAFPSADGDPTTGFPGVVFPDGQTLDITAEGMISAKPHDLSPNAHAALFAGITPEKIGASPALSANINYYLNALTGNDANDGLTSTTPFATLEAALDKAARVHFGRYSININISGLDTVYSVSPNFVNCLDVGHISLNGTENPTDYKRRPRIKGLGSPYLPLFSLISVNNLNLERVGARDLFISIVNCGFAPRQDEIALDIASGGHVRLRGACNFYMDDGVTRIGQIFRCVEGGIVHFSSEGFGDASSYYSLKLNFENLVLNPSSSVFFLENNGMALLANLYSYTVAGAVTGKKWELKGGSLLSVINQSRMPGTIAGTVEAGSILK